MQTYLVGGAVRDMVLNKEPHDRDYVVFGATVEEMTRRGYQRVGKDFPVFLHPETKDEYALARKEVKTGSKHTDFEFIFTPDITMNDDVQRRDFTCNALYYDEQKKQIVDLVGGCNDIQNRIIRHVNAEHFSEDPLRVLRMCRFAAKLDFTVAPETMLLAKKMVKGGMIDHLTAERVWKEFESALKTDHFDKFILCMKECGALKVVMPEVAKLWEIPEIIEYHPEGNSGEHTMLTLRRARKYPPRVKFALLMHDIGKINTPQDILPHHYGHDKAGIELIKNICRRLKIPNEYRDFALLSAKNHMRFYDVPKMRKAKLVDFLDEICKFKDRKVLADFIRVCRCDKMGRGGTLSREQSADFYAAAERCLANYKVQSKIRATDIPNYENLPQNKNFAYAYHRFRESLVI